MPLGPEPTGIDARTVLLVPSMTVTVPMRKCETYTRFVAGLTPQYRGLKLTGIVAIAVFVSPSITVTELPSSFTPYTRAFNGLRQTPLG